MIVVHFSLFLISHWYYCTTNSFAWLMGIACRPMQRGEISFFLKIPPVACCKMWDVRRGTKKWVLCNSNWKCERKFQLLPPSWAVELVEESSNVSCASSRSCAIFEKVLMFCDIIHIQYYNAMKARWNQIKRLRATVNNDKDFLFSKKHIHTSTACHTGCQSKFKNKASYSTTVVLGSVLTTATHTSIFNCDKEDSHIHHHNTTQHNTTPKRHHNRGIRIL